MCRHSHVVIDTFYWHDIPIQLATKRVSLLWTKKPSNHIMSRARAKQSKNYATRKTRPLSKLTDGNFGQLINVFTNAKICCRILHSGRRKNRRCFPQLGNTQAVIFALWPHSVKMYLGTRWHFALAISYIYLCFEYVRLACECAFFYQSEYAFECIICIQDRSRK